MKRILLFILFSILISPVVNAQECNSIQLTIYVDFVSKVRWQNVDSEYKFPFFREFDILRVEKINFINDGKCEVSKADLILKVSPSLGYGKGKGENYGYFKIPIPKLKPSESAVLKHNNSGRYYYEKNDKIIENMSFRHGFIGLDQLGDWTITAEVDEYSPYVSVLGYTIFINNNDIKGFRVYSYNDLLLLKYNANMERLTKRITTMTFVILFLTAVSIGIAYRSFYLSRNDSKIFKNIESHLDFIKKSSKLNKNKK